MALVGSKRFLYFRVDDAEGNPVDGLAQSAFTILLYRDGVAATDTLTVSQLVSGLYLANYIPSAAGTDYLEISYQNSRFSDTCPISADDIVVLNDSFGDGEIKPDASLHPETFTLYVFASSDWNAGNRDPAYARGSTALNSDGTWVKSIYVQHGVYTVVLVNFIQTIVLRNPIIA